MGDNRIRVCCGLNNQTITLTEKGRAIRDIVAALFKRHAEGLEGRSVLGPEALEGINGSLKRMERFWTDQIRYIY